MAKNIRRWVTVSVPGSANRDLINDEILRKYAARLKQYGSGLYNRKEMDYTASNVVARRMRFEIPRLYRNVRVELYSG